jgi:putative acetyltransferase
LTPGSASRLAVRPERPADRAAIHALVAGAFPTDAEARLVDLLRASARLAVSLVAVDAGEIVGHVAFSPVTVAAGAGGVGLAPLAVAESRRGRGVGGVLVRAGLDACRAAGWRWVVVLGEPAYYGRFGFAAAVGFGLDDDYAGGAAFQALELVPGALAGVRGRVRYAPEFATVA